MTVDGKRFLPRGLCLLALAVSLCILVLAVGEAEGRRLVAEDDFTGVDGNPPDSSKWTVHNKDSNDYVKLESNTLRTHIIDSGYSYIESKERWNITNFTMTIDWRMRVESGRACDIRIMANDGERDTHWLIIEYGADHWGWTNSYIKDGTNHHVGSFRPNATKDKWYSFNYTLKDDRFSWTVRDRSTGAIKHAKGPVSIDSLPSAIWLDIGVFAGISYHDPSANFDNFRFYNLDLPPNRPPVWGPLPDLTAVEDVPRTYDFSSYVSDLDHPLQDLSITSESPFVDSTQGLNVTFLFPNNVLEADVVLVLTDGLARVNETVHFNVEPVNDAPFHAIPAELPAVEDEALTVDLSDHVWDVDNDTDELSIVLDDPFATVDGLNITVTFPEGVTSHTLWLNVTDGLLSVGGTIHFEVQPVDDPPVILKLPAFNATEDHDSPFNLSDHINDVDTPIEALQALARERNCTVEGLTLVFHFPVGGLTYQVPLEVTDGTSLVHATLVVHVLEVNDPPVVGGISPKLVVEDTGKTVELVAYISDEDNDLGELMITSDHPAVVDIVGFNLTLLYTEWVPEHTLSFTVSDGISTATGDFVVQVRAVNDPPSHIAIGDLEEPVVISVPEGTEEWFDIHVTDEDSPLFKYSVACDWDGVVTFSNGTLRTSAPWGDVGEWGANLTVDDRNGGKATLPFHIKVENVNEPPTVPILVKPHNHTVVVEGENVTFQVDVVDPDMPLGDVLTVTWISNVSQLIAKRTTDEGLGFITDQLPVGDHHIEVSVTDGEFVRKMSFELTVVEKYVPPPDRPDEPHFLTEPAGIATILVLVIVTILGVALAVYASRREDVEEGDMPPQEPPAATEPIEVYEEAPPRDLQALAKDLDQMATSLERAHEAERVAVSSSAGAPQASPYTAPTQPEASPAPRVPEEPTEPTPEQRDERRHAEEVREVMKSLTQLPRGLPTSLWGWDMSALASVIVDGERKAAPDGTPLVKIEGRLYNADTSNLGQFLQEWKEEPPEEDRRGELPEGDRLRKLDMLEERLLEGKISEETYERLRRKYTS